MRQQQRHGPFFVAALRLGSWIGYYLVLAPLMLVVLGVPVAMLLSYPAEWYGTEALAATLAGLYLLIVWSRRRSAS